MSEACNWRAIVSMALKNLIESDEIEAASVIRNGRMDVTTNAYDNLNGGITYYDIVFKLKYRDFSEIGSRKSDLEGVIDNAIQQFHTDEHSLIANVIIEPEIEQILDWQATLPETKGTTLQLIHDERQQLEDNATGQQSYKSEGVEEEYRTRHERIIQIAKVTGFDYPITCSSLAEWWIKVKDVGGYAERRAYISELFTPVINQIQESDETAVIDFSRIVNKSEAINKAIDDANTLIRSGRYDSAVDRIHTAFFGYLRFLLDQHNIPYVEGDTLAQLYTKLHIYYGETIQPNDVGVLVKTIMRSSSGTISAINDFRNRHTVVHPNDHLINKREAQLAIRLINSVVDYIEDVENTL